MPYFIKGKYKKFSQQEWKHLNSMFLRINTKRGNGRE